MLLMTGVTDFKNQFNKYVDHVGKKGNRVLVQNKGKDVAVLISIEDYAVFEAQMLAAEMQQALEPQVPVAGDVWANLQFMQSSIPPIGKAHHEKKMSAFKKGATYDLMVDGQVVPDVTIIPDKDEMVITHPNKETLRVPRKNITLFKTEAEV